MVLYGYRRLRHNRVPVYASLWIRINTTTPTGFLRNNFHKRNTTNALTRLYPHAARVCGRAGQVESHRVDTGLATRSIGRSQEGLLAMATAAPKYYSI